MSLENLAIVKTDDLPIKHEGDVHSGKVRSVYWLTKEDSKRLIEEKGYNVHPNAQLGAMVISDRLSAFECIWQAEERLMGPPQKGACLNAVSHYWFKEFDKAGLAGNHILDSPHPLVWIVQKAKPVLVEAIARQYITGSMWRAYEKGERNFCGIKLPEGLKQNQRLKELLITPSTKGIIRGIPGIPEDDDVNVSKKQILNNYMAFGFRSPEDVDKYETLLVQGCNLADKKLISIGKLFVDTKFEFGYIKMPDGNFAMIYMDEVLTPDSSRFWESAAYAKGQIIEDSKEGFRQFLLNDSGIEKDILLNKKRMDERKKAAAEYKVPVEEFMKVSETYKGITEKITGEKVPEIKDAKAEIVEALSGYGVIE